MFFSLSHTFTLMDASVDNVEFDVLPKHTLRCVGSQTTGLRLAHECHVMIFYHESDGITFWANGQINILHFNSWGWVVFLWNISPHEISVSVFHQQDFCRDAFCNSCPSQISVANKHLHFATFYYTTTA